MIVKIYEHLRQNLRKAIDQNPKVFSLEQQAKFAKQNSDALDIPFDIRGALPNQMPPIGCLNLYFESVDSIDEVYAALEEYLCVAGAVSSQIFTFDRALARALKARRVDVMIAIAQLLIRFSGKVTPSEKTLELLSAGLNLLAIFELRLVGNVRQGFNEATQARKEDMKNVYALAKKLHDRAKLSTPMQREYKPERAYGFGNDMSKRSSSI